MSKYWQISFIFIQFLHNDLKFTITYTDKHKSLKSSWFLQLQQLRLVMGQKVYRDLGLTYYHISHLNEILVSGKPQKNVIGFDAHSAYTFADSKKKPLEGNAEMKNNLVLPSNDVCASFAVHVSILRKYFPI